MSSADLTKLKIKATALRNLASQVLEDIAQLESAPSAAIQPKRKSIERQAALTAQLLSGRRKPLPQK